MNFASPIHFSSENKSTGWKIKDWDTANGLLSYLDIRGNSFICFQKENGSYIQCAGSKKRLTVEARVYEENGAFRHFVFGKGNLKAEEEKIETTEYHVSVDSTQVLQMRHARLIMKPWLEGEDFPDAFHKTDITDKLKSEPADCGNG